MCKFYRPCNSCKMAFERKCFYPRLFERLNIPLGNSARDGGKKNFIGACSASGSLPVEIHIVGFHGKLITDCETHSGAFGRKQRLIPIMPSSLSPTIKFTQEFFRFQNLSLKRALPKQCVSQSVI